MHNNKIDKDHDDDESKNLWANVRPPRWRRQRLNRTSNIKYIYKCNSCALYDERWCAVFFFAFPFRRVSLSCKNLCFCTHFSVHVGFTGRCTRSQAAAYHWSWKNKIVLWSREPNISQCVCICKNRSDEKKWTRQEKNTKPNKTKHYISTSPNNGKNWDINKIYMQTSWTRIKRSKETWCHRISQSKCKKSKNYQTNSVHGTDLMRRRQFRMDFKLFFFLYIHQIGIIIKFQWIDCALHMWTVHLMT